MFIGYGRLFDCLFGNFLISGRFKSKETDFLGFITKVHISRYVDPSFMLFMSQNLQHSVVLEYIFYNMLKHVKFTIFHKNLIFLEKFTHKNTKFEIKR